MPVARAVTERLDALSIPEPNTGCVLFLGYLNAGGYGVITVKGEAGFSTRLAHRVAYESHVGSIPSGLTLDHLCRVRACVNWRHLEAVTRRENALRGYGRAAMQWRSQECPNGHPYTAENTRLDADGGRNCRTCERATRRRHAPKLNARMRAARAARRAERGPKSACANGHAYTEENTYRSPDGHRQCLTCRREHSRNRAQRRRAAMTAAHQPAHHPAAAAVPAETTGDAA